MSTAQALREAFGSQSSRARAAFGALGGAESFASNTDAYFKVGSKVSKSSARAVRNQAKRGAHAAAMVMDDGVVDAVVLWASTLAPAFVEAVVAHVVPHADRVRNAWPRRSGKSKAGLVFGIQPVGEGQIAATFEGLAPYTLFVRYALPQEKLPQLTEFEKRVEGAIRQSREKYGVAQYGEIAKRFRIPAATANAFLQRLDRSARGQLARANEAARAAGQQSTYGPDAKPGAAVWALQARKPWAAVVGRVADGVQSRLGGDP